MILIFKIITFFTNLQKYVITLNTQRFWQYFFKK